jgi:hypothetical protein
MTAINDSFTASTTLAETEPDLGIVYGLISDDSVDTEGDVVLTPGINTAEWEGHGAPYLFFHPEARNDSNNAVGEAGNEDDYMGHSLGTWRDEHMLWAALWHDTTKPKSKEVYDKYKNGEWDQFSIGFDEVKGQISTKASYCSRFGANCKRVIAKATLTEVSAVPGKLAVNQNTTTLAVKATMEAPTEPLEAPTEPLETKCMKCGMVIKAGEAATKDGDTWMHDACKAVEVPALPVLPTPIVKAVITYVPKKTIYYKSNMQDLRKKGRIFISEG